MEKSTLTLFFVLATLLQGQGTVENSSFYSSSLNENRNYQIYLPEGYDNNPNESYPVVYFLHGFSAYGSYTYYIESIMDNLIGSNDILKMIVVLSDGGQCIYDGSFYTNSELNGDYEDYIVYDLVDHIDDTYQTKPMKEYRALSGHSMGGYGTMYLAMRNSNVFTSLSAHSGPIALEDLNNDELIFALMWENGFGEFNPNNGNLTLMFFAMASAFSPNLDNPPYYVDLPIDQFGQIVDDIFNRWMEYDPYNMIYDYIPELENLNIYFDCGSYDELTLHEHSVDFSNRLGELNIDHEFVSYPGSHTSGVAERVEYSMQVHSDYFESVVPYLEGDVNQDGDVNIGDIVRIINIILGDPPSDYEQWAADLNHDSVIDIFDIIILVDIILYANQLPDACYLEPDIGPCDGYFPRYYFDWITEECTEFIWGGCEGVVPFETLEECEESCLSP